MRYEWTGDGLLLLGKRKINKNDPNCDLIFTDEECPAAERFVIKGMAKRLDPPPTPPVVKTILPKPKPAPVSEVKIGVGVMEATLGAGVDGNFGTDDDTLEIKPRKKAKAKPEPKSEPKSKPKPEPKAKPKPKKAKIKKPRKKAKK